MQHVERNFEALKPRLCRLRACAALPKRRAFIKAAKLTVCVALILKHARKPLFLIEFLQKDVPVIDFYHQ